MSYNPENLYRCTIIRGKSRKEMDDLLPAYAGIVSNICPCTCDEFNNKFNDELSKIMFGNSFVNLPATHQKTIRNHITEVAGKLLGLYWINEENIVFASGSTEKLLEDNDQPAFFKNLCLNFQFPNGSQKYNTIKERIDAGIKLKPFHFLVNILSLAKELGLTLTKDEISYYVLASYDVLCGIATPQEVLSTIIERRKNGINKKLPAGSYDNQHIKEQLNLLELANIIRQSEGYIILNSAEKNVINIFLKEYNSPLKFNIFHYDLQNADDTKRMYSAWSYYYGSVLAPPTVLKTSLNALQSSIETATQFGQEKNVEENTIEIGDAGENLVFEMEKQRVRSTHPRLENKVILLGKQRGIGYDISSVEAGENKDEPEFARFIEVKSTKRTTVPNLNDSSWLDTINLTRKEWIAAKQYRDAYNIYRVYYTPTLVIVRKISDPFTKNENGIIEVLPTMYRMDFGSSAIDKEYSTNGVL